jgi:hypothetical protein
MKPPVLLCYNLGTEQGRKIMLLAMRLKIRVRPVKPEEYGQTLAALCGLEPEAPAPADAAPFADPMLVLANFSPELINHFLYGFKQDHIVPVGLKAILTETNQSWHSAALHSQLAEEHAAMAQGKPPVHEP